MKQTLRILSAEQHAGESGADEGLKVLQLPNDADPLAADLDLEGVDRIELQFPKFTDGRAYSQAIMLRRRRRFAGDIRATGDVFVDLLVHMQRSGFSSAVLREGVDASAAQRQFERYAGFYQGDVEQKEPLFAREH